MITVNQRKYRKKIKKKRSTRSKILNGCPQLKGECIKVFTGFPKKPNSAVRKLAKVLLSNKSVVTASIPGQGHKLQEHSNVLVRGGRVRDLPGVQFKLIKGKFDFTWAEKTIRLKSRSKYGVPNNLTLAEEYSKNF